MNNNKLPSGFEGIKKGDRFVDNRCLYEIYGWLSSPPRVCVFDCSNSNITRCVPLDDRIVREIEIYKLISKVLPGRKSE